MNHDDNRPHSHPAAALAAPASSLPAGGGELGKRLAGIHAAVRRMVPSVTRIGCALYDEATGELRAFIDSTEQGVALRHYVSKLSPESSLYAVVRSGQTRLIDDLASSIRPGIEHSNWLLQQGYRSSFTVPLHDGSRCTRVLFYDSDQLGVFGPLQQRDLLLYGNLLNMAISAELAAVRYMVASVHVAREFANLRDFETGAHLERISRYAVIIGRSMAHETGMSDEQLEHLRIFAPLHDIGKIGIPDHIPLKPSKLDADEWSIMRSHVEKGVEIVNKILGDYRLQELPDARILLNLVACHHEFVDGTGYSAGLKGDAVPVEARIITVADIFDALTSRRPYKAAWNMDAAFAELRRMADAGKIDHRCIVALRSSRSELDDIIARYPDER